VASLPESVSSNEQSAVGSGRRAGEIRFQGNAIVKKESSESAGPYLFASDIVLRAEHFEKRKVLARK
jgi:hypothetical protein